MLVTGSLDLSSLHESGWFIIRTIWKLIKLKFVGWKSKWVDCEIGKANGGTKNNCFK